MGLEQDINYRIKRLSNEGAKAQKVLDDFDRTLATKLLKLSQIVQDKTTIHFIYTWADSAHGRSLM